VTLPILDAAPGMPVHFVRSASTTELPAIDPTRAHTILQPPEPHRFRLRCDDDTAVDVGDSRFTVIELEHGTTYRIFATAVVDYVSRADALDKAGALVDDLEAAGFEAAERIADATAQADEHEHVRISALTAPFGSGSWRAEVWLRTAVRRGTRMAEILAMEDDACLVNLVIYDEALSIRNRPL
jgi:hypothetical protein